jgi:hypothetical protein
MKTIFLSLIAFGILAAQTPAPTPSSDEFFKERQRLQKEAKSAFDTEMAREKAGDCPNANTTLDIVNCMSAVVEKSTATYKVYLAALRAMLAQPSPYGDIAADVPGPTGKPLTREQTLNEFDRMETAWGQYYAAICTGASDFYKGGTAWHPQRLYCDVVILRSHLRELAVTYGESLSH